MLSQVLYTSMLKYEGAIRMEPIAVRFGTPILAHRREGQSGPFLNAPPYLMRQNTPPNGTTQRVHIVVLSHSQLGLKLLFNNKHQSLFEADG